MEEDIDILLEEVENKFLNVDNEDKPRKYVKGNFISPQSSYRCDSSDYDDILRDVDDNPDTKSKRDLSPREYATNRCFPVFLGGSEHCKGYATIGSPKCCSNLHCISCDFAVYSFDDYQWSPSTDYLFLRTNMPDFERVKSRLVTKDGYRAYACQCRHYSTSVMQDTQAVPMLTWICRHHHS